MMKEFVMTWSTVFLLWIKARKLAVKLWGEEYVYSIENSEGMFG